MVSVPVRLYKAARRERIKFHHVYRSAEEPVEFPASAGDMPPPETDRRSSPGAVREFPRIPLPSPPDEEIESVTRVRHAPLNETLETQVPRQSILKGFEVEKDRYVVFDPKEISALRPETSSELQILEFVRLAEIDPMYFDSSYYVAPDKGGEKPYAILFQAMEKTGFVALGSLAMHGREHATVIRPGRRGLILHTLFYAKEVRSLEEWRTDTGTVATKELELATLLVRAMQVKFEPEKLKDTFEERVQGLIDSRASVAQATSTVESAAKAPVVDIMEALRQSLEARRKPVERQGSERKAKPASPKRKRG